MPRLAFLLNTDFKYGQTWRAALVNPTFRSPNRLTSRACHQSRFFANALPDEVQVFFEIRAPLLIGEGDCRFDLPRPVSSCVGIAPLVVGFEARVEVFGEADVEAPWVCFCFYNVCGVEFHGVLGGCFLSNG